MKVAQEHALAFFRHMEATMHSVCQKLMKAEPPKGFFNSKAYLAWMDALVKAKASYETLHTNRVFVEYSQVHAPAAVIDVDSGYKELFMDWFLKHQLSQLPVENATVS